MQGNQLATQQPKNAVAAFKAVVNGDFIDEQLTSALAENKGAFVSSLVELYTGDKALQSCNPKLVALEAVKAASLNLPINKALGFAYIVVYNNSVKEIGADGKQVYLNGKPVYKKMPTPTFVLGYKGFIQLASRTGQYRTINATPVYEGELRACDRLTGAIDISGKKVSDRVIGYAGYIEYLNGFSKAEYVSVEDMAKHALKYSPSLPKGTKVADLVVLANKEPEAKKVGWLGNFNDMAVKTLIRRLISKYGYMSIQMQNAIAADINSEISMTASDRDNIIEETSTQVIDVDASAATYEVVDPETGEIKEQPQPQATEPAPAAQDADPGY